MARNVLGLEFDSAAQLSKRPGSLWNCLWGNALKRSPGIIRKSRVSYPGPGFLSSATWPMLPKKHYNGLNQTIPFLQTGLAVDDVSALQEKAKIRKLAMQVSCHLGCRRLQSFSLDCNGIACSIQNDNHQAV